MKTKLSLTLLLTLVFGLLSSQVPQGFNYQAIARDGSGNILPNTSLQAMMYVQSLSTGGTIFWKELHSSVTTNSFGLFTLVVGTGTRQTESTVALFDLIDWSVTPKYLKTEIYYSSSWKDMGTSQLMSVPYAMTSGDLTGTVDKLSVKGTTSGLEDALFEVKNKDGQTVFAVYNEGVRVYVSDGAKAVKGGFAVGGFGTDKAESSKYLFVGKDSVRIYLDTNPLTKKLKGGFAVGGYDLTKGTVQDYLDVNADSVRIYIDSNPATKKLKGGFAVGGYDMTKDGGLKFLKITPDSTRILTSDPLKGFGVNDLSSGNTLGYLRLTPSNYFIGHQAGRNIASGLYNSIIGYQSGYTINTGNSNSFMGHKAGYTNSSGNYNVFIGNEAGFSNNGSMNTFVGYISGRSNTTGYYNSFFGDSTGFNNTTGYDNTYIGARAGYSSTTGGFNTFIGAMTGYNNITGKYNTAIGASALNSNTTAISNTAIGYYALKSNTTGSGNTATGSYSLQSNTTGASNTATGDFSLSQNTTAWNNTATGHSALYSNTTGKQNTAIGKSALSYNTTANYNTATGCSALTKNTTGGSNTANGFFALYFNTIGNFNTAIGNSTLIYNTTGKQNTAAGSSALYNNTTGIENTAFGDSALYSNTTGSYNTAVGFNANVSANNLNNATAIGYNAVVNASNKIVLGNASATTVGGYGAWTNYSDLRLKENILYRNDLGLDFIMKLKTISFNYKNDINKHRRDGLIAQDVQQTLKDLNIDFSGLVVDDDNDQTLNLSYGEFVMPLINAVQEQQQQIESYKSENDNLKSQLQSLQEKVDKIEVPTVKDIR